MSTIYIDFETCSNVNIAVTGARIYAEDDSTDITMMGYKIDRQPIQIEYDKEKMIDILTQFTDKNSIVAYNAEFEFLIYNLVLSRYGAPRKDIKNFKCTQAKCYYNGFIGDSGGSGGLESSVAVVSGCRYLKEAENKLKIKKYFNADYYNEHGFTDEDRVLIERYCKQDVFCNYFLDKSLEDLSHSEHLFFSCNVLINNWGVPMDTKLVNRTHNEFMAFKDKVSDLSDLNIVMTNDKGDPVPLTSTSQKVYLKKYLISEGVDVTTTGRDYLSTVKTDNLKAKEVIDRVLSSSSAFEGKLKRMKEALSYGKDKIYGSFVYHKNHSGRWSGSGVQMMNLPRITVEDAYKTVLHGVDKPNDVSMVDIYSSCVRPCIKASKGHILIGFDFSNIEPRILSLISNDWNVLEAVKNGIDIYKNSYSKMFNVSYDDVTKEQRQLAKIIELSLAYGGGVNTLKNSLLGAGFAVTNSDCFKYINTWKRTYHKIVDFWEFSANMFRKGLKKSIEDKSIISKIPLPSGRSINYIFAGENEKGFYYHVLKKRKLSDSVETLDNYLQVKNVTSHGMITNHIVQSLARDVQAHTILNLIKKGFKVVFHCHDEIVIEYPVDDDINKAVRIIEKTATKPPEWLKGIKLDVETQVMERYLK